MSHPSSFHIADIQIGEADDQKCNRLMNEKKRAAVQYASRTCVEVSSLTT